MTVQWIAFRGGSRIRHNIGIGKASRQNRFLVFGAGRILDADRIIRLNWRCVLSLEGCTRLLR
jgi:hypothetical protein